MTMGERRAEDGFSLVNDCRGWLNVCRERRGKVGVGMVDQWQV